MIRPANQDSAGRNRLEPTPAYRNIFLVLGEDGTEYQHSGIGGLPNVGKSPLLNAVTRMRNAMTANYRFGRIEPNSGVPGGSRPAA